MMIHNTHHPSSIVLSALIIGLLASCGPSNPDNTVEPTTTETQTSPSDASTSEKSSQSSDRTQANSTKPTLIYYQMPG